MLGTGCHLHRHPFRFDASARKLESCSCGKLAIYDIFFMFSQGRWVVIKREREKEREREKQRERVLATRLNISLKLKQKIPAILSIRHFLEI
jgi:hypothetical protein